jgi:hypothetical protein
MDDRLVETVLIDLRNRVLMLEAGYRAPLSIALSLDEKRWEPHEDAQRRHEAFKRAETEAERVGHHGPVDNFMRKLKAGEFDRHSRHNGGGNAEVHQRAS